VATAFLRLFTAAKMKRRYYLNSNYTLISNEKCWIESTALSQLSAVSNLPCVTRTVGLPDLHAGKSPVGIAAETMGIIYPHLIGNDIGCGMSLFETHCPLRKFKQERYVQRLNHIRALADIPSPSPYPEDCPISDFGALGGGNHFAEFQIIDKVYDQAAFNALGIDSEYLLMLIHSGSRGYGQRILTEFLEFSGLPVEDGRAAAYLKRHDDALLWAGRNRRAVAEKLTGWLGYDETVKPLLGCFHNFIERRGDFFIHRKGAVSADAGPVIIPSSRGSLTYLVTPKQDTDIALRSLSHGAGRKWARSLCKSRIRDKYDRDSLRQNKFGGRTVCHDTELLYQEAPEAYKNIEHVISALVDHGLCNVIATLRPLLTYKG